jgi:hypothetical protein
MLIDFKSKILIIIDFIIYRILFIVGCENNGFETSDK